MESKETFKSLVESVVKSTGMTQEQLAVGIGYGKNYISESLSPTGKLSKKFVSTFKAKYLDFPKLQEGSNDARLLAHDALFSVLVSEIAQIKASASGEHPEVIVKKIYKAAEDVSKIVS